MKKSTGRTLVAIAIADDLVGEIEFLRIEPPVFDDMLLVDETDLVDLTDSVGDTATASVPSGTGGWRIALEETGEKTLAETSRQLEAAFGISGR